MLNSTSDSVARHYAQAILSLDPGACANLHDAGSCELGLGLQLILTDPVVLTPAAVRWCSQDGRPSRALGIVNLNQYPGH